MTEITTKDCKDFLNKELNIDIKNLKRIKKYKDKDGLFIREFSTGTEEIYCVKELENGTLILLDKKPENIFNAKKFLKSFIKELENQNDFGVMGKILNKVKNFNEVEKLKIANEFFFFFPDNVYNNNIEFINNGLNTKMIRTSDGFNECFCICFYDSLNSEPDLYLTDIVKELVPEYFDKVDEYFYELDWFNKKNENEILNLTIKDVIEILEKHGFKYKNNKDFDEEEWCMLKKLNLKK